MAKYPVCKCGHSILMHDGDYGRTYCMFKEGCKCSRFEFKEYSDKYEFKTIQIDPNIDNNLILLIDAFIHGLCELGYGYISNGTEGDCVLENIYNAFLEEPNKFIRATTPEEIIKRELKHTKKGAIV